MLRTNFAGIRAYIHYIYVRIPANLKVIIMFVNMYTLYIYPRT